MKTLLLLLVCIALVAAQQGEKGQKGEPGQAGAAGSPGLPGVCSGSCIGGVRIEKEKLIAIMDAPYRIFIGESDRIWNSSKFQLEFPIPKPLLLGTME